jgi:fatty acid desaturase
LRRIKGNQKHHWHYQYQYLYAPILYGLLSLKFRISDFNIIFFLKKNGAIRVNNPGLWHTTIFFLGKILFVLNRLVLPHMYGLSLYDNLSLFFGTEFVLSWYLACVFQVNHVVPQVAWPRVDTKTNMVNMDWARSQVETTIEYGHGCGWTHFFSGGLNYQSVHHLLPFVSQAYYPEIAPIVKKTCSEFGVNYVILPNFWEAFKSHLEYLKLMGHSKHA